MIMLKKFFKAGQEARLNDLRLIDNPHGDRAETPASEAWKRGWLHQHYALLKTTEPDRTAMITAWTSVDVALPEGGDKRKLVWLVDCDGMAWVGIRMHFMRNDWLNNGQPEPATVTHWMDLPERPDPPAALTEPPA